jgi:hypothetical protein
MKAKSAIDNPFARTLQEHGLDLVRDRCHTLQVNVGLICDLACRHCHLSAGPTRRETMSRQTMEEVIDFAGRVSFQVADITGGAPELVPDLDFLLAGLAPVLPRIMLRSNLTALGEYRREGLIDLCRRLKVAIVASLAARAAGLNCTWSPIPPELFSLRARPRRSAISRERWRRNSASPSITSTFSPTCRWAVSGSGLNLPVTSTVTWRPWRGPSTPVPLRV